MLKFLALSLFTTAALSATIEKHTKIVPVVPFNPDAVPANPGSRIVGGNSATEGEFPFVNEVDVYMNANLYWVCSGAFLSTMWTISSMQCMRPDTAEWEPIYVRYGSANRNSANRKILSVVSFSWFSSDARIDFALLKHQTSIIYSQYVGVIQLPTISDENNLFNGLLVTHASFGGLRNLQYHLLTVNSNAAGCAASNPLGYERNSICSKSYTGASKSEEGDPGSPWFFYENYVPTLIGVQWGNDTYGNQYGTRISSFLNEISETVGLTLRP